MAAVSKIVVLGGGAGGLELASMLGRKLGRRKRAEITLIDAERTHIWKPLLHEVAAGTLDSHQDELEYLAQAYTCGFRFRLGYVDHIDLQKHSVSIAATVNDEGDEIIPRRPIDYDKLVIAVGSVSHDFAIPGVKEHCLFLDTKRQAEAFQRKLLEAFLHAHSRGGPQFEHQLHVSIVGGGATGVELAAQLHDVTRQFTTYGLDGVRPDDIRITVIEAGERILPALPERLSNATRSELEKLGIRVLEGRRVVAVGERFIKTADGDNIHSGIKVWAAGIRAPAFLNQVDGLETNQINQVIVSDTLRARSNDNVYAIGDCAACDWKGHDQTVPPRAQAAHQQATRLARNLIAELADRRPSPYQYRDYGSLVSLGKYTTVGNLMGRISGSVMIEGYVARLVYLSLYKMHQRALYGLPRVFFLSLANLFRRAVHPKIKLH